LGLRGKHAIEWDQYLNALTGEGVNLKDDSDQFIWIGGNASGQLTMKNAYLAFYSTLNLQTEVWRNSIWKWDIQLKIKLFIWLAIDNFFLTWDILHRRGWEGPSQCILCKNHSEDINHLFIDCCFSKMIWDRLKVFFKFKKNWEGKDLSNCFYKWTKEKMVAPSLTTITIWYIWIKEIVLSLKTYNRLSTMFSLK